MRRQPAIVQSASIGNRRSTGDALMKPKPLGAAPMNTMSSQPSDAAAASRCRRVPVPLDELMKIASEFLEGGRLPEAEKMLDHILAAVPDSPLALHQKGVVLFRAGHHRSRCRNGRARDQACRRMRSTSGAAYARSTSASGVTTTLCASRVRRWTPTGTISRPSTISRSCIIGCSTSTKASPAPGAP